MNDFTRCPGCRLIRPEGEGLCPSCLGLTEPRDESDAICPCGDPDCSRPFGHPDPRREGIYIPPVGGQPGRTVYGDFGPGSEPILKNPDPEPEPFRPAEAYRPDQSRGEATAQACLELPDSGPLFAGCPEVRR